MFGAGDHYWKCNGEIVIFFSGPIAHANLCRAEVLVITEGLNLVIPLFSFSSGGGFKKCHCFAKWSSVCPLHLFYLVKDDQEPLEGY